MRPWWSHILAVLQAGPFPQPEAAPDERRHSRHEEDAGQAAPIAISGPSPRLLTALVAIGMIAGSFIAPGPAVATGASAVVVDQPAPIIAPDSSLIH